MSASACSSISCLLSSSASLLSLVGKPDRSTDWASAPASSSSSL
eukprot:CAMPEP_0202882376 /NCGR_PEP_ID=MMETSP1391-20130828/37906_1 /ASSEMBLY_ACC=CAM_ASM_000867 /TAXON_ID=1034604 /ORGANISM="Chlamydomonas leiostraca, Strain SAG 11-49" /LENGTH=43 /DNA_ID= /DNA_START= /DNA_END= /DNA_ORIENTATION=